MICGNCRALEVIPDQLGCTRSWRLSSRQVVNTLGDTLPNLVMRVLSATMVADLVTKPAGTQSGAIDSSTSPPSFPPLYLQLGGQYLAISEGPELGIRSQPGPFEGLYLIDLTSSALSLINASSGLFGLGITWTPNTGDQFPSGSDLLSFNASPRLILGDSNVPLPGTAWALLPALFLLLRNQSLMAQRLRSA